MSTSAPAVDFKSTAEAALAYAARGWPVFPCKPGEKTPLTDHGFKDASTDTSQITAWWTQWPSANVGIATGAASGLIVFDFDVKSGQPGTETFHELQRGHGQLLTLTSKTPSGGWHLLFEHPGGDVKNRAGLLPGLDIRGDGGYIVAPGSSTAVGAYTWLNDFAPAPLPAGLLKLLNSKTKANGATKFFDRESVLDGVHEGQRDDTLYRYVCSLQAKGNTQAEAEALVRQAAANCKPEFPEADALEKVRRVYQTYPDTSAIELTDAGNAERLVAKHGDNLRYVPEWGWLSWDGARWARDELLARKLAIQAAKDIHIEAAKAGNADDQKSIAAWARKSQQAQRVQASLWLAQPAVVAKTDEFDRQTLLLPVLNGTLDLRTGRLHPHNRDHMTTRLAPVIYEPSAKCPTWQRFLERIQPDPTVRDFLQRLAGYSLTGSTAEQALAFLYGTGRNGKSVFIETLAAMLGDYHTSTRIETLAAKQSGIPNDVAALAGARLVSVSETPEGVRLNESLLKDLTGGDTISARFLRCEFFQFQPQFKLLVRGNHKPQIRGTDDGIWRRLLLVPFSVQIPLTEVDAALPAKLLDELPGIMAWAVQGCLQWQKIGLGAPDCVLAAGREYRADMDLLGEFISDRCVVAASAQAPAASLYGEYKSWAEHNGHQAVSATRFGLALSERGYRKEKRGTIQWLGIGLSGQLDGLDTSPSSTDSRAHNPGYANIPSKPSDHPSAYTECQQVEFQNGLKPSQDAACREVEFQNTPTETETVSEPAVAPGLVAAAHRACCGLAVTPSELIEDLEVGDYRDFTQQPELARLMAESLERRKWEDSL